MASQRADFHVSVGETNAIETCDTVDVHQQGGMTEPHVEGRDQALPTCENPGVFDCQQLDRVRERTRPGVLEWCGFQSFLPAAASLCRRRAGGVNAWGRQPDW